MSDSPSRENPAGAFSRRALLVGALAGTAVVAVGCTGMAGGGADAITPAEADQLAAQVDVQTVLVGAYDDAFAAAPELAIAAAVLADQARQQLERLRAAAPGTAASSSGASPSPAALDPAAARAYLRAQIAGAAAAHAAACPGFTGARAALLGSIAAGLRGQVGQLA